jgi:hypothetical protein
MRCTPRTGSLLIRGLHVAVGKQALIGETPVQERNIIK